MKLELKQVQAQRCSTCGGLIGYHCVCTTNYPSTPYGGRTDMSDIHMCDKCGKLLQPEAGKLCDDCLDEEAALVAKHRQAERLERFDRLSNKLPTHLRDQVWVRGGSVKATGKFEVTLKMSEAEFQRLQRYLGWIFQPSAERDPA